MVRRHITQSSLFAAAVFLVAPLSGLAQMSPTDLWGDRWVVGGTLGGDVNPSHEFARPCEVQPQSVGAEAGVSLRRNLGARVGVEGTLSFTRIVGIGTECPTVSLGLPSHSFHERRVRYRGTDGQYLRTGLRLVGRQAVGDMEVRGSLGASVAPAFRALGPTAGVALAVGSGPLRLVLEGEGWWHSFVMRERSVVWEGGELVTTQDRTFRGDPRTSAIFRVGGEFHPGFDPSRR